MKYKYLFFYKTLPVSITHNIPLLSITYLIANEKISPNDPVIIYLETVILYSFILLIHVIIPQQNQALKYNIS